MPAKFAAEWTTGFHPLVTLKHMIIDTLPLPSKSMSLQSGKNESLLFPHYLMLTMWPWKCNTYNFWERHSWSCENIIIVEIIWRKAINLSVHGTMATYRKVNVQYLLWICVHTFWLRGSYTLWFLEHMQQILVMYVRQVRNECEVSDLHTYHASVSLSWRIQLSWQQVHSISSLTDTGSPVYYV